MQVYSVSMSFIRGDRPPETPKTSRWREHHHCYAAAETLEGAIELAKAKASKWHATEIKLDCVKHLGELVTPTA